MPFLFHSPTRIRFGVGTSKKVGDEIKEADATRALVVTDPGIVKAGIAEEVLTMIKNSGVEAQLFEQVQANPRDTDCIKGAELAREKKIQIIVGLGGGSPMDTAKCIGVLLTHEGTPVDWDANKRLLERNITPLICIPTTSGTGSEVTNWAVITDTKRKFKMSIGGNSKIAPLLALIDPALTVKMPPIVTGSTGMDALVHAIEAYTCRVSNPISDALALRAIQLISHSLLTAVNNGGDMQARTDMMLASTVAGMAFNSADVASVHSMAEAVGGVFDTPHGIANSMFLPIIFETNIPSNPAKHAQVAELFGVKRGSRTELEVAKEGAQKLKELARAVKTPTLRQLKVEKKDLPTLASYAAENVSTKSNPIPLTQADYLKLFERCYAE
jgi:alcohol dehydrogenase